jgi:hypothetical protein
MEGSGLGFIARSWLMVDRVHGLGGEVAAERLGGLGGVGSYGKVR